MEEKVIKTKFTVASEEGIDVYHHLVGQVILQKYGGVADGDNDSYVTSLNREHTVIELNTFSNQLIVVYVDEIPAGYAFLKGSGLVPEVLENKRNICIAAFEILEEYLAGKAKIVLIEKCLNICKSYEGIWLIKQEHEPGMRELFEAYGFYMVESVFVKLN